MAQSIGASPIDPNSLAGMVRVLIGDTDPTPLDPVQPGVEEYAWFSDEELEIMGTMMGNSPKRVAIWVLSQVALSQSLLLKKWTSEDLQIDGPAITRGMEATLKRLSADVDKEEAMGGDQEFFGIYGGGYTPRVLFEHGNTGWWLR